MLSTPLLEAASISITFMEVPAAIERQAAHVSAGIAIYRVFTVHRPGENLRHGCLTGTSGTAKQVGMSDSVCFDLIFNVVTM